MPKTSYNVQPLRTKKELDDMKWSLRRFCFERDYYLFLFGINTGLRISDILALQVKDVKENVHIRVVQKKNQKVRIVKIGHFGNYTKDYIKGMADEDYLFASRKGKKPISDTQAYRALVKAGKMIDRDDIGTHTMRKTFGYFHYKRHKDVATLQQIFSHSTSAITKRYMGVFARPLEKVYSIVF